VSDERKFRDASTGEYVTPEYAAEHPDTTVAETDRPAEDAASDTEAEAQSSE
jgi:hypothetical protein